MDWQLILYIDEEGNRYDSKIVSKESVPRGDGFGITPKGIICFAPERGREVVPFLRNEKRDLFISFSP